MARDIDWLVIGGGSGGIASARRAAQHGASTVLVDPGPLGGTCVNRGCVPKKVMWHAAQLAEMLADARGYGFAVDSGGLDWAALVRKRRDFITRLNGIYDSNLSAHGVHWRQGHARFVDPQTVEVGGERLRAKRILIATGSRPSWPDIPGAEHGVDSDGFFDWEAQPDHVTVVGGGYIAVELAGVLRGLGSQVTLLVRGERLLRGFDHDLAAMLEETMRKDGIGLRLGTTVEAVEREGDTRVLRLGDGSQHRCDALLWATGRQPEVEGLGLDAAGLDLEQGRICVDEQQRTQQPHIYALGDVTGGIALTPVAIATGRRLADCLFADQPQPTIDPTLVPTVVFAHPPIGTVGLSEEAAIELYGEAQLRCYRSRFNALYFGVLEHKVPSLVKLICVGDEERVVGLHTMGVGSDELLQGFAVAMQCGATKADFDRTVAIHPTAAEELVTLR